MTGISLTVDTHPAAYEIAMLANARGLGVRALAREVGCDHGTLSKMFAGKSKKPDIEILTKCARVFGVTVGQIMGEQQAAVFVPFNKLKTGPNPRKVMDREGIERLSLSFLELGIQQPLVVRTPDAQGDMTIIFGQRRHAAAENLVIDGKWGEEEPIPAIVRDVTDRECLLMQLAENLGREDMHPLDEAEGFAQLALDGMKAKEIAATVSYKVRTVQQRIKVWRDLSPDTKFQIRRGKVSLAQGEALCAADWDQQKILVDRILAGDTGLATEKDIKAAIKGIRGTTDPDPEPEPDPEPDPEPEQTDLVDAINEQHEEAETEEPTEEPNGDEENANEGETEDDETDTDDQPPSDQELALSRNLKKRLDLVGATHMGTGAPLELNVWCHESRRRVDYLKTEPFFLHAPWRMKPDAFPEEVAVIHAESCAYRKYRLIEEEEGE